MKTAHDVIIRPIITEASMSRLADKKYTFEVASDANKIEIKKAVEEIFKEKGDRYLKARIKDHRVLRQHDVICDRRPNSLRKLRCSPAKVGCVGKWSNYGSKIF